MHRIAVFEPQRYQIVIYLTIKKSTFRIILFDKEHFAACATRTRNFLMVEIKHTDYMLSATGMLLSAVSFFIACLDFRALRLE